MSVGALRTNFVINVFGAVVPLVVALVTVPIYVRHIGDARYGVLSLVWALLGYFGFLDLGLSRAAANALARLREAPHEARARVLVTTLALNLAFGLVGGVILAAAGGYLMQHALIVPDALRPEIAAALPWIAALLPLALASGVGIGALESRERFLLANILQTCGGSLGQIAPVVLAVLVSPSLAVVIPAAATARALTVVAIMIAVYRAEGPLSIADFDPRQIKTLLSYGGWVTVSSLMSPILSEFDQFVIGSLLGVAAITHYVVPMNLVMRSQILAAALSRTLFPRMSSLARDDAHSLASRAVVSLAYGYCAVCAPAIIVTPAFFRYWIGPDFSAVASPVAEILFFGAWINGLAFVPFGLLQSQGRPDVTGKFHAAELVPFVAVLWAMTSAYGIVGAAIAWSLRCAIDALCLFWAPGIPASTLLRALPLPLLVMAASAATANAIGPNLWPAIGAAIGAEVAAVALALVMAHDLKTLARTMARRGLRAIGLARADLPAQAN